MKLPMNFLPLRYLASRKLSVFLFHKVPGQADPLLPHDLDLGSFEQLLDSVVSSFNVMPLDDAAAGMVRGKLPPRAACITFDDGYDSWLPGVVPALERRNMHATFYITTGQFEGRPLWHERIANVVRHAPGPVLDISHPACAPLPLTTPEERTAAVVQLERFLKYFALEARDEILDRMERAVGTGPDRVTRMSMEDLRGVYNRGFGIGAHTDNHPILVYCDQATALHEIGAVRETLSGYIGGQVTSFAYPNGRPFADFSAQHVDMVKKAGYTSAVTTQRGTGLSGADWVYQIPRFTPWGQSPLSIALQLSRNLLTPAKFVEQENVGGRAASPPAVQPALPVAAGAGAPSPERPPLISVVTAVYNGAHYVEETIRSVLAQTVTDFEYIIIDDASTDNSVELIQAFQDPRIKLVRNPTNQRLVATRNIGLSMARGRYVALIDHDDVAMPDRLAEQLKAMEADSGLVLTGSWAQNVNAQGLPLMPRVQYRDTPEQSRIRLLFRNQFVNSTLMFRRLDGTDIRYRPEFPLSEDYDFIVRLSTLGRVAIIPKVLVKYRIHKSNYSDLMKEEMVTLSREVKRLQVERLGVAPSADDLAVHAVFEYRQANYKPGLLPRVAEWAGQLVAANERTRLYDQRDFLHVYYNELAMAAEFASRKGKELLVSYVSPVYLRAFLRHPTAAVRMLLKLSLGLK